MSMRGRGGGRGGRGGGRGGGNGPPLAAHREEFAAMMEAARANSRPMKLYPDRRIPRAEPLLDEEILQVKLASEFISSIRNDTPYYVLAPQQMHTDEGDGIERFADRYKPKRKAAFTMQDIHIDEKFIPEELHIVVRGPEGVKRRKKRPTFDRFLEKMVISVVVDRTASKQV
ncbi:hypothetical protein PYCC9005_003688 [Savitreella phatthalungensis]